MAKKKKRKRTRRYTKSQKRRKRRQESVFESSLPPGTLRIKRPGISLPTGKLQRITPKPIRKPNGNRPIVVPAQVAPYATIFARDPFLT